MSTILVIEDDNIMLKAIKNILTKDNYDVITAKDGKEAFEKVDNEQYDAIILDLMMPYANGLEIISHIRNNKDKRNIGIIVCSAIGIEETITESFRLGADDFLKKPILAGELKIRIQKLLLNRNSNVKFITKKK
jgi:DNA-binding response OmpR family regulator